MLCKVRPSVRPFVRLSVTLGYPYDRIFQNNLQEHYSVVFATEWQRSADLLQGDHSEIPGGMRVG